MKFVVSASALYSNLQILGRVIVDKNAIAILDSFLFTLNGNVLKINASDGDILLETEMEVSEGVQDGKFAINAKVIQDLLKDLPEQPITIVIDGDTLKSELVIANGDYQFMANSGDEYPEIKRDLSEPSTLEIDAKELLEGVSHTLFATANDELRPVMNGIFFDRTTAGLSMVASDTHKLMCYTMPELASENPTSFILPKKPATMLKNILPKEEGNVLISHDSKSASFVFSRYRMTCLLIEGKFPAYRSVIPKDNEIRVIIDRSQLLNSLRRINSISQQAGESGVELDIQDGKINLITQDINYSFKGKESLTTDDTSITIRIGFKAAFLIETLSNMGCIHICLELKDPSRAGIIRPMDSYDTVEVLGLVMPMMLRNN